MKTLKKILAAAAAAVMAVSAMGLSASAEENYTKENDDNVKVLTVTISKDDPVGTKYDLGNGLICQVIDKDIYDKIVSYASRLYPQRGGTKYWSRTLSGRITDGEFTLTAKNPYYHVAAINEQTSGKITTLTVYGQGRSIHVDIPGGAGGWVYTEEAFPAGNYTARASSAYDMAGSMAGFIADSLDDVIYNG